MVNATAAPERRQHRGRVTAELMIVLRATARPTPLVTEPAVFRSVGCLECMHDCGGDGCGCGCGCCPYPHPLPAVVGTVVGTGVGA